MEKGGNKMMIETQYQDEPVCPHCGWSHSNAWEWEDFGPGMERSGEFECIHNKENRNKAKNKMIELPTPETDAEDTERENDLQCELSAWHAIALAKQKLLHEAKRERDEAFELLASEKTTRNHIIKRSVEVEQERDEAREKVEQQRKEIVRLNGATNHAGGTPLKIALRERDEAREDLEHVKEYGTEEINAAVELRQRLATALVERDEAREALAKILKNE